MYFPDVNWWTHGLSQFFQTKMNIRTPSGKVLYAHGKSFLDKTKYFNHILMIKDMKMVHSSVGF
jgi:hypothetical protein